MTGNELGEMVGLRKDQISKIESGRRRLDVSELPRVAAGVGALAVGFGLELLRRNLLARLTRSSRSLTNVAGTLPTLRGLQDVFMPQNNKSTKLPKGYEIHETVVYLRRVIRRED